MIGKHLVRPDGTISLGEYGSLTVADLTIDEAQVAITRHLKPHFKKRANLQVTLSITDYSSKTYYVILRGSEADQVVRQPLTGNQTVQDVVSLLPGLPANLVQANPNILLVRKMPNKGGDQWLPIDWKGITQRGITTTNYQILPGDRLFVGYLVKHR